VSDEIHCDLVLERDLRHVPIASLAPEISRRTVTLMSANKTFNIPAAGCGWAIIEDRGCAALFQAEVAGHVIGSPSVFGLAATLRRSSAATTGSPRCSITCAAIATW
jgi:cystathionine beta-lyase